MEEARGDLIVGTDRVSWSISYSGPICQDNLSGYRSPTLPPFSGWGEGAVVVIGERMGGSGRAGKPFGDPVDNGDIVGSPFRALAGLALGRRRIDGRRGPVAEGLMGAHRIVERDVAVHALARRPA